MAGQKKKEEMEQAYNRGVQAGHACYEGKSYEENPYPQASEEWSEFLDGFSFGFESADENDV